LTTNNNTKLKHIKYDNTVDCNGIYSLTYEEKYPKSNDAQTMEIWIMDKIQMIITSDVNTDERHHIMFGMHNYEKNKIINMKGGFIKNDDENIIEKLDN
jgi:hypothetical protein